MAFMVREVGSLHGLGTINQGPADVIASIATGAADLYATFTGQKAAAQAQMTQVQLQQLQTQAIIAQQDSTRTITYVVGGVLALGLVAAVVSKIAR